MTILRGFQKTLTGPVKCNGCGRTLGPDVGYRVGFEVKEGPVQGLFHSKACYENKAKGGEKNGSEQTKDRE